MVADTIVERRDVLASVVWRVIGAWDAGTVARKFELQVGKDLQYIRLNGTLVGGAVGVEGVVVDGDGVVGVDGPVGVAGAFGGTSAAATSAFASVFP